MGAFKGAFEVGAHALETDVHLTRDGVVVLSHVRPLHRSPWSDVWSDRQDATLKRCFGVDERILDCDWTYISHMRTIQEPRQAMPTLEELLRYLAEPDHKRLWLLLDIKVRKFIWSRSRISADCFDSSTTTQTTSWDSCQKPFKECLRWTEPGGRIESYSVAGQ